MRKMQRIHLVFAINLEMEKVKICLKKPSIDILQKSHYIGFVK